MSAITVLDKFDQFKKWAKANDVLVRVFIRQCEVSTKEGKGKPISARRIIDFINENNFRGHSFWGYRNEKGAGCSVVLTTTERIGHAFSRELALLATTVNPEFDFESRNTLRVLGREYKLLADELKLVVEEPASV